MVIDEALNGSAVGVGRTVHFAMPDGKCLAAVVTGHGQRESPFWRLNLNIQIDDPMDAVRLSGDAGLIVVHRNDVSYSEDGASFSWHWPERV